MTELRVIDPLNTKYVILEMLILPISKKIKSKSGEAITNSEPILTYKLNIILHKQAIHQGKNTIT